MRRPPNEPGSRPRGAALSPAPSPEPLRIAHVTEYYYPHVGGICEHVHFFAREARERGHHVDVITSRIGAQGAWPGDDDAEGRGRVIRVGRSLGLYANGSHARTTLSPGVRGASLRTTVPSEDGSLPGSADAVARA